MESLIQDIRYAFRQLRRSPGFTAAAAGTLALGIGAGTAVFSLGDAALLRPLPVSEPDRLVLVHLRTPDGGDAMNVSQPLLRALRDGTEGVLSGVAGVSPRELALRTGEGSVPVTAEVVSPGYFGVMGGAPRLGAGLPAGEAAAPAAVLSSDLWTRRFGADPGVVGRTVALNGRSLRVAGVAPPGFRGTIRGRAADVWVPLSAQPLLFGDDRSQATDVRWLYVVGRLAPGVGAERARAALRVLPPRLRASGAGLADGESLALRPIPAGYTGWNEQVADPLLALAAVVGLVLLIACANVANLLLARGAARGRELAVRRSLGAGPTRIARQLLTESLLLSAIGGAGGVLLGVWAAGLLAGLDLPMVSGGWAPDAGLDGRVLAFAIGVTTLTGVLFGLAPAVQGARRDPAMALRGDPEGGGRGRRGPSLRDGLVVAQVALSLVLLLGAGLFLRTLWNLRDVEPGFAARDVLLATTDLEAAGYDAEAGRAFYDRLLERVRALPGVEAASLASTVTPQPGGSNWSGAEIVGREPAPGEEVSFDVVVVGPDYFRTLSMPLLRGSAPEEADAGGDIPVVVNRWMAERYWDGEAAGGRMRIGDGEDALTFRVAGVTGTGKYRSLREEGHGMVYLPVERWWNPSLTVLARARGDAGALAGEVRAAVAGLDPAVPVADVHTLGAHLDRATATERLSAWLTAALAGLALLLASVGVYGVLSYLAARRAREVGIRMAVGARRGDIVRLFLGRGARLLGAGIVVGTGAGLLLSRAASGLLYGVEPADPWTLLAATGVVGVAGVLATWIPSRRAAAADPSAALRGE